MSAFKRRPDLLRVEWAFALVYSAVIIAGAIYRANYEFPENVARSLNASAPLASVTLGLLSIVRSPVNFAIFAAAVYFCVILSYTLSYGFSFGFRNSRVYFEIWENIRFMVGLTGIVWATVGALKFVRKLEKRRLG